jgi:hypothetical protein
MQLSTNGRTTGLLTTFFRAHLSPLAQCICTNPVQPHRRIFQKHTFTSDRVSTLIHSNVGLLRPCMCSTHSLAAEFSTELGPLLERGLWTGHGHTQHRSVDLLFPPRPTMRHTHTHSLTAKTSNIIVSAAGSASWSRGGRCEQHRSTEISPRPLEK